VASFRNGKCRAEYKAIVELAIGKPLPKGAEVHHVDSNPYNNENSNLVVCESRAYHCLLHSRARAIEQCGDVSKNQCRICGEWKPFSEFYAVSTRHRQRGPSGGFPCKVCSKKMSKENYESNRDSISEKQRDYYEKNKKIILERNRQYYQANKEEILKQYKSYRQLQRETNLEAVKQRAREYMRKRRMEHRDELNAKRRQLRKQRRENNGIC